MSRSEFEHENIVTQSLSASAASKPADLLHVPEKHDVSAAGLWPLRSGAGKGFLRRRLHRQHQGQEIASDHLRCDQHSLQSRTSRRGRRRPAGGRRRRHPGADPARLLSRKARELGFKLPEPGDYAVGVLFMPKEKAWRKVIQSIIADQIKDEGLMLLGWRDVPTDNSSLGETVKPTEPANMQVFIGRGTADQGPRSSSNGGSTSSASRSRRRSISAATAAWPAIIRARCRAAP